MLERWTGTGLLPQTQSKKHEKSNCWKLKKGTNCWKSRLVQAYYLKPSQKHEKSNCWKLRREKIAGKVDWYRLITSHPVKKNRKKLLETDIGN